MVSSDVHLEEDNRVRTVSTVGINGLEQPQHNPDVDGEYVEVPGKHAVKDRTSQGSESEDEYLSGVSILGRETEWCRIFVMKLVDMFVKDTGVKSLMSCFGDKL